jgi:hypothetical protein
MTVGQHGTFFGENRSFRNGFSLSQNFRFLVGHVYAYISEDQWGSLSAPQEGGPSSPRQIKNKWVKRRSWPVSSNGQTETPHRGPETVGG